MNSRLSKVSFKHNIISVSVSSLAIICIISTNKLSTYFVDSVRHYQSELLGQFRLIGDRASDVSGERICLTQNAYAEI